MLDFFWPALLAIAVIHSTTSTLLPRAINLINVSSDIPTLTVPGHIDPRFAILMTSEGTEILNADSGLMAITKMMHRLTESNFDGMIEPTTYVHNEFPATSVSIRGLPGDRDVQTRFAVWGIYRASIYVLQTKVVRTYTFKLTFDNSDVGYIDFARTQVRLSPAGSSSNDQNHTQSLDTLPLARRNTYSVQSSGDISLTSPPDQPLRISYVVVEDQDLTKWEIFANIYTHLGFLAEFPSRQRIQETYTMHATSFPLSRTGLYVRTSPSVVRYGYVATALITIAYYIVTLDILHGIIVRMELDEELIGEGFILRRHPSRKS